MIPVRFKREQCVGKSEKNGYMTVFLSLVMTVLLSLCLTLIEGARSNAIRVRSLLVSNIAVDSIMAEYHRELAKQFNLFAIDDSYGSASPSIENTENHLAGYLIKNFNGSDFFLSGFLYRDFFSLGANKAEVEGVLYMTDEGGNVFRRRAYEALKDDVGLNILSEIVESARYIENNGLESMNLDGQMSELQEQARSGQRAALEDKESKKENGKNDEEAIGRDMISEVKETQLPDVTDGSYSLTSPMVLFQMVEDVGDISTQVCDTSDLFSKRKLKGMINSGNLKLEDEENYEEIIERFVFKEYLISYF